MEHLPSHETHAASRPVAHIVSTPGTCGGKPRIADTRIRVQDIVVWHEAWGRSPEEIVTDYSHLTLTQVHTALAYYYDHREAIRQDMADDIAFVEAFKREHPDQILLLPEPVGSDTLPRG